MRMRTCMRVHVRIHVVRIHVQVRVRVRVHVRVHVLLQESADVARRDTARICYIKLYLSHLSRAMSEVC